jgi:hypothetical protein
MGPKSGRNVSVLARKISRGLFAVNKLCFHCKNVFGASFADVVWLGVWYLLQYHPRAIFGSFQVEAFDPRIGGNFSRVTQKVLKGHFAVTNVLFDGYTVYWRRLCWRRLAWGLVPFAAPSKTMF